MEFIDDAVIINVLLRGGALFNRMFREYYKILAIHAYYVLNDINGTQDLVQDVFAKSAKS